ncbi:MAG: SBBP repeat-containing protein [Candidatus Binatus sp.]|uniref:DUF7948 domain-containing protein n=1 Tax=Candidatus Binatus sp. TaxID=2811406 RepID=UPI003D122A1D
MPVIFEPNVGQAVARVKFLSRTRDGVLFIASDEAILALSSPAVVPMRRVRTARVVAPKQSGGVLTMRLVGANPNATVEGRGKASARINYFIGRDPSRWHTNIPTVNEVVAHDAWPGIDVSYSRDRSAGPEAVECTFTVRAGANPSAVRLAFDAPGDVDLTPDGNVETAIGVRKISFTKPRVFEESVDGRRQVAAKFVAIASDARTGVHRLEVRFEVARRDPGARMVIDPSLIYSTYLGGSGQANASTTYGGTGDSVNAIALDKDGNEYLTGGTTSQDFPATNEAFVSACTKDYNCGGPAFITKLDGKTGEIVFSTLLGGSGGVYEGVGDEGNGIVVDQFGNAYVAGATSSENFPTTPGAFVPSGGGGRAPFVTKLSADGSSLVYSTLLQSPGIEDCGNAIAIDESGNAYVTGMINFNAFAIVLNTTGTAATYAVALASATGYAVALTSKNEMWIGGQSDGQDFPTTGNAFQRTCKKCNSDAAGFVALLDPAKGQTRKSLIYSTYLGGSKSSDIIRGIAVDSENRAWAVGSSSPRSLRGNRSEVKKCAKGTVCGNDALLAIIDASKSGSASLAHSLFIGGEGNDIANAIYLDGTGKAYIGGQTTSPDFPVTSNAVQSSYTPCTGCEQFRGPAFVAVVNPTSKKKSLLYSTYLGGATVPSPTYLGARGYSNLVEVDAVNGIAVDAGGVIHAAGLSYASGFPTTGDAQQTVCKACATLGSDGFIARINPGASTGAEALEYSSFIGGAGPRFSGDSAAGVAMDSTGAVYLAGSTASPDFPVTPGAFQQNCAGCAGFDVDGFPDVGFGAFVAKLNPAAAPGDQLIYATYLDGSSSGEGTSVAASGIAVDATGEAYTVGVSYTSDFPITPNAYSNSCPSGGCVFFAKLDSTGSNLLYSSFIGDGSTAAVAVDPEDNALIAGTTKGNMPTTPGAVQSVCGACLSGGAGFFSKMDPSASGTASLVYSTYLSGSGGKIGASPTGDALSAIAADANGNAILTGQATSLDFPTTSNAYQTQCQPFCESPVISVINPALSGQAALVYSTYLNGTGGDSDPTASPYAVAVDSSGDIYIGGQTFGYDFPVSPNAFIPQCPGVPCEAGSGFISELNPNAAPANQLVYGTYLGGTSSIGYEAVTGLGVDSNGEIYAAGHTLSADFPVTPDAAQPTCLSCPGALQGEGSDGFLTVLNPAASGASQLVYSTFLGGNNYDAATGLAMGPTGLVAVAGYSSSTDFPTTSNALKLQCPACRNTGSLGSNRDAFVSVFQF